jgi:ribonuclease HII
MSSTRSDPVVRRSRRLLGLQSEIESREESTARPKPNQQGAKKIQRKVPTAKGNKVLSAKKPRRSDRGDDYGTASAASDIDYQNVWPSLPRLRENQVLQKNQLSDVITPPPEQKRIQFVIGIDEAGRGPLAGPVVAAAIYLPDNLPGIIDSKKIGEDAREQLYETITASPAAVWAVAVIDAAAIDRINILQATLLGMRVAAAATIPNQPLELPVHIMASTTITGCYVIRSRRQLPVASAQHVHALIDGNRLPNEMDFCSKECLVKGDGREYSIAAASILAKVTRDRLMREYSEQYPLYNLEQHKGYGTAAHMRAIAKHGASPIHRLTFAPLKHMNHLKIDDNNNNKEAGKG